MSKGGCVDGLITHHRITLVPAPESRRRFFFFLKDPPPPEFSPLPHHAPLPTPPPASRYSSLARGTLVKPGALAFPVIAGVTGPNGLWNTRFVYDRGSRYVAADVSGIISTEPPKDRKSTRLNSSHSQISYAVFCL